MLHAEALCHWLSVVSRHDTLLPHSHTGGTKTLCRCYYVLMVYAVLCMCMPHALTLVLPTRYLHTLHATLRITLQGSLCITTRSTPCYHVPHYILLAHTTYYCTLPLSTRYHVATVYVLTILLLPTLHVLTILRICGYAICCVLCIYDGYATSYVCGLCCYLLTLCTHYPHWHYVLICILPTPSLLATHYTTGTMSSLCYWPLYTILLTTSLLATHYTLHATTHPTTHGTTLPHCILLTN